MYSEARKLHLIEAMLKVKSESVLIALENILKKNEVKTASSKSSIYDFVGIFSESEASLMNDSIEEANSIS
ncbi:hypothetical protein [Mucilaginibacter dorajii]|uniref:Uncharacterized protein n=1 Tax=Mucilaginibacter dorajii TaxID=692994 RepID=A0ABP7Q0G4_9SPHI|nr:hypothetical protein [Mucilaginibacter dorajii]MCS3732898.1 hypothetical protein [Mucilaginibacter dorajii]